MRANRSPARTKAALLLCLYACAASAYAGPLDAAQSVADRLKSRIKSVIPPVPAVPSAPTPAAPAPAPGDTSPVQAKTPPTSTDTGRFSEAEKAYVPAQATTRVADGPRRAN